MHEFIDAALHLEMINATKKAQQAFQCFKSLVSTYKVALDVPSSASGLTVLDIIMDPNSKSLTKYKNYLTETNNAGSKEGSQKPSPSISPKQTSPRDNHVSASTASAPGTSASSSSSSISNADQPASTLLPPSTPAPTSKPLADMFSENGKGYKTPKVGKTSKRIKLPGQTYGQLELALRADPRTPERDLNRVGLKRRIEERKYADALQILNKWNPTKLNEIRNDINKPKDNESGHTVLHLLVQQMRLDWYGDYINPEAVELFNKITNIEGVLTNIPDKSGLTVDGFLATAPDALKEALGRSTSHQKDAAAPSSSSSDSAGTGTELKPPHTNSSSASLVSREESGMSISAQSSASIMNPSSSMPTPPNVSPISRSTEASKPLSDNLSEDPYLIDFLSKRPNGDLDLGSDLEIDHQFYDASSDLERDKKISNDKSLSNPWSTPSALSAGTSSSTSTGSTSTTQSNSSSVSSLSSVSSSASRELRPPYSYSTQSTSSSPASSSSSLASTASGTPSNSSSSASSSSSVSSSTRAQRPSNGPVFPRKKKSIGAAGTVLGAGSLLAALLAGTYYAKAQKQPVRAKNDNRPLSTKTEQAV